MKKVLVVAAAVAILGACGGGDKKSDSDSAKTDSADTTAAKTDADFSSSTHAFDISIKSSSGKTPIDGVFNETNVTKVSGSCEVGGVMFHFTVGAHTVYLLGTKVGINLSAQPVGGGPQGEWFDKQPNFEFTPGVSSAFSGTVTLARDNPGATGYTLGPPPQWAASTYKISGRADCTKLKSSGMTSDSTTTVAP